MKVIRDSVHGDLEFSPDEMRIIHAPGFQRLHGLKQLGLTYLIYPGAKHSRFEHVLGVTHLASAIWKSLEKFFDDGTGFSPTTQDRAVLEKTLRFAALLHDMGHVPFGHTLEDEMPVIPKHDDFGEGSEPSRMESAVREILAETENENYIDPVLQVLRAISRSKADADLYGLVEGGKVKPEYIVLADIVGNTLCADLLDYIVRDHMMTGIRAQYDPRIFQYFGVEKHAWKHRQYDRVVVRLVRHGRFRKDALGDLLDILKLRYNLSDKVLFHPLKCAVDTMLIKAVHNKGLDDAKLMQYSDDGLLDELRDDPLVKMIRQRDPFKPVFVCDLDRVDTFQKKPKEIVIRELHENIENVRTSIEKEIERRLGLPEDKASVLIFCPRPDMTLKPVLTFVQWKDGAIRRLNEIREADDRLTSKQVAVLQEIYPALWKLYLFVRPDRRFQGHKIATVFKDVLKEKTGLTVACDPAFENYLEDPEGCWEYWGGKVLERELGGRERYRRLEETEKQRVSERCWRRMGGTERKFDERFIEAGKSVAFKLDNEWIKSVPRIVDEELEERRGN